MAHKLSALIGVAAVLLGAFGIGSGCTPTDRDFASGGQGGQGGQGCPAGFAECDGNPETVCETDTASSLDHCGMCDHACAAVMDANIGCIAGMCSITSCNNGRENCDKFYDNGCETNPTTSFDHCGMCGNSCEVPNAITACVAGACQLAQCIMGNLDCDMDPKTGCEVDPVTNADHCGGCGQQCMAPNVMTMMCVSSTCAIADCNANFGDCNMAPVDGCETDLLSDPHHCNGCGKSCGGGVCNAGVCNTPQLMGSTTFIPGKLVIFKTDLFIGTRGPGGEIGQMPLAGGMPVVLAATVAGAINALDITPSGIFIAGNAGTVRIGLDGSSPYNYGAAISKGIAADVNTVYWAAAGLIRMGPTAGGSSGTFVNGQNGINGLAFNNNLVYWPMQDGSIWSSQIALPLPAKQATGPTLAANLVIDTVNMYWSSSTGIHWTPKSGGTAKTLAMTSNTVRAIAIDATHVYWTDESAGLVQRVLKDGSGMSETLALEQPMPYGVAVDAQFVYWSNQGTKEILKLPK